MGRIEEYYRWLFAVLDYAEVIEGFDPIGCADIREDLSFFCSQEFLAYHHGLEGTVLPEPSVMLDKFRKSNRWGHYWPGRDNEPQ